MLDLIKDGIAWIAGFLGFGDVEDSLNSFSFSAMFNEFLDDIYAWFNLLFSDPVSALSSLFGSLFGSVLSVGDFILDMIKKPLVWLMELFGWDDAAAATESFSLSGWVMGKWEDVKAWFTGIFSWGKEAGATEEGGWSFMKFIGAAWDAVKQWFIDKFTFSAEEVAAQKEKWKNLGEWVSLKWQGIKDWFVEKFTFSAEEVAASKERWKNLGEFVALKWQGIKDWFTEKFTFASEGISEGWTNLTGFMKEKWEAVKKWFTSLFEFEGEGGEKIGLGGKLLQLFTSLIDKIISIIPGFEAVTDASKYWDITDIGAKQVDTAALQEQVAGMSAEDLKILKESFKKEAESTLGGLENKEAVAGIIAAREKILSSEGKAKGGIVTKPTYLPASGVVVGEHSSWSGGKGAAGGGVPEWAK